MLLLLSVVRVAVSHPSSIHSAVRLGILLLILLLISLIALLFLLVGAMGRTTRWKIWYLFDMMAFLPKDTRFDLQYLAGCQIRNAQA